MGDHSKSNSNSNSNSNSHALLHILGFANLYRTCKSFLSKCYPDKQALFFKKKPKPIEEDPKIGRIKYHKTAKKHNHGKEGDELRRPRQGNRDDGLGTQCCPAVTTGSGSGRFSRNMSYHGRTPGQAAKGSLSRSLSHKEATTTAPLMHTFSRSTSKGAAAPIIFSNSSGLLRPPTMEKQLECTLEDLCFGCVKKVTITRDAVKPSGRIVAEDETMTIKVEPGWRRGTKIRFEGKGNQMPGTQPADVVFIIAEKEHSLFKREEDDLQLEVEILLVNALTGCTLLLPLLGGQNTSLKIEDVVHPGYEQAIEGEGMPKQNDPGTRGDLIVKISVKFPEELTPEQRTTAATILQQSC